MARNCLHRQGAVREEVRQTQLADPKVGSDLCEKETTFALAGNPDHTLAALLRIWRRRGARSGL